MAIKINLRMATVDDAGEIARIRTITWRAAYAGLIPDSTLAALDIQKDAARWRDGLANLLPERCALIAEAVEADKVAPEIAGYCLFGPNRELDREFDSEVYAIYVHPSYHRKGIGKMLFQAAMDWLTARGHQRMIVYVLAGNTPSRKFYEHMGGVASREQIFEIDGAVLPEVGYGYQLPSIEVPNR